MPNQSGRDSRSAMALRARRLLGVWPLWAVALAISAIFIVPLGFEVGIRLIPPDAVRVTASSTTDGHVLVSHEITDPHVVADLYSRINRFSFGPVGAGYHCGVPGPITYDFSFTRWGVVVEDAKPIGGCAALWGVSRGGIGYPYGRLDSHGATLAILSEARLASQP